MGLLAQTEFLWQPAETSIKNSGLFFMKTEGFIFIYFLVYETLKMLQISMLASACHFPFH